MTEWVETDDLIQGDTGYYSGGKSYTRLQIEHIFTNQSLGWRGYLLMHNSQRWIFDVPMPKYDLFPDGDEFSYSVVERGALCTQWEAKSWCHNSDALVSRYLKRVP